MSVSGWGYRKNPKRKSEMAECWLGGVGNLLSQRIPNYRNLMNSYSAFTAK